MNADATKRWHQGDHISGAKKLLTDTVRVQLDMGKEYWFKIKLLSFLYELFVSVSFSHSVSLLESFLKLKRCLLINIFSLYTTLNTETNLDSIEGGALALNCRSWIDIGWRSVPVLQSPICLLHSCFVYWLWSICESVRICTLKTN